MNIWGRFEYDGKTQAGRVCNESVELFSAGNPLQPGNFEVEVALSDCRILAPLRPGKIIAVGLNYARHAAELGMKTRGSPLTWLESPTSVAGPDQDVILRHPDHIIEAEVELAVVIGSAGRDIHPTQWQEHVWGYTLANDITDRTLQKNEGQFYRAKSFDTYTPLGPFVRKGSAAPAGTLQCRIDGEIRQIGDTSEMLFSIPELVEFCSRGITLEPGDVILSGAPEGKALLYPNAQVSCEMEGFSPLRNTIKAVMAKK